MRIRLKAPCFFNNHLYQPGDIIDLPEGVEGPHKSRAVSMDRIDYDPKNSLDANRILGDVALEPLFDVVEDEPKTEAEPVALLEKPDEAKSATAQAELHPLDDATKPDEIEQLVKPPPAPSVTSVEAKAEEADGK